jgi:hypothetical protein
MLCELIKEKRSRVLQVIGKTFYDAGEQMIFNTMEEAIDFFYNTRRKALEDGWVNAQYYG